MPTLDIISAIVENGVLTIEYGANAYPSISVSGVSYTDNNMLTNDPAATYGGPSGTTVDSVMYAGGATIGTTLTVTVQLTNGNTDTATIGITQTTQQQMQPGASVGMLLKSAVRSSGGDIFVSVNDPAPNVLYKLYDETEKYYPDAQKFEVSTGGIGYVANFGKGTSTVELAGQVYLVDTSSTKPSGTVKIYDISSPVVSNVVASGNSVSLTATLSLGNYSLNMKNGSATVTCYIVTGAGLYGSAIASTSNNGPIDFVVAGASDLTGMNAFIFFEYSILDGVDTADLMGPPVEATVQGSTQPPPPPPGGVVCFLGNAPVLTPSGYRRIDSLHEGDEVKTADGRTVAIQRAVHQRVTASAAVNPYVIERGQFGATKRLLISPEHRVAVAGRGLVEARHLGLQQEERTGTLDYYNLELPSWERDNLVVAGVEVESLAPVRRIVVTQEVFRQAIARQYGAMTPAIQAKILRTCKFLSGGRVEVPAVRR